MPIVSFYADKVEQLARLSLDNPGKRRSIFEQRCFVSQLRDDLPEERRAHLMKTFRGGISIHTTDDDIDRSKIPAGIWLVGDQGVYVMSNISMTEPDIVTEPIEHAVQCFETDVRNVGEEGQDQAKVSIFGGDDGVIFLDAEFIIDYCEEVRKGGGDVLMLNVTRTSIKTVTPDKAASYQKKQAKVDKDFFDPDHKSPPTKLWRSPEGEGDGNPQI